MNIKIVLLFILWVTISFLSIFAQEFYDEQTYTSALIEMSVSYEAAKNQKVCDAERVVVALSQCKKRSA